MEVSQAFTTYTSAMPQFVYLIGEGAPPWWVDISKTVVGAFFGAGFAFAANYYLQRRQRKSDQKLAGNIALVTISRQYSDFIIAKAGFSKELSVAESNDPPVPSWRAIKPSMFEFDVNLHFDFNSLAFLVEDENDTLLAKLVDVENRYHEFRKIQASHNKAAAQLQRKFVELGWNRNIPADHIVSNAVGLDLVGELDSLSTAIKKRIENQEQVYVTAGQLLEQHMRKNFSKGVFCFKALGIKPGHSVLDKNETPKIIMKIETLRWFNNRR